jgi:hypothetical protein
MPPATTAHTPDPAAAFARWQQEVLAHSPDLTPDLYADDVVVEAPFTGTGQPHRIEGLAAYAKFVRAGRASLPFRLTDFEDVLVHRTEDPATAVVEYRLSGQVAGQVRSAPFLVVVTVDEQGRITRWREYQDRPAIVAALANATPA